MLVLVGATLPAAARRALARWPASLAAVATASRPNAIAIVRRLRRGGVARLAPPPRLAGLDRAGAVAPSAWSPSSCSCGPTPASGACGSGCRARRGTRASASAGRRCGAPTTPSPARSDSATNVITALCVLATLVGLLGAVQGQAARRRSSPTRSWSSPSCCCRPPSPPAPGSCYTAFPLLIAVAAVWPDDDEQWWALGLSLCGGRPGGGDRAVRAATPPSRDTAAPRRAGSRPGRPVLGRPRLPAAAARPRPASWPPTRSSTSTSIPAGSATARRRCGTRARSAAGSRTRRSATCGRSGRGTGPCSTSACPTGWPSGCGSGRCVFAAGTGVLVLARLLGLTRTGGHGRRRRSTACRRTCSTT